jgi:Ca2+-binding EF-hand superfamily protein
VSKDYYKHVPSELIELSEIIELFYEFDEDNSGALDIHELHTMFIKNNFAVTKNLLRKLFKLVKT